MHRYALVFLVASLGLAACKGPGPKKVGDATLARAMGVEDLPAAAAEAPLVEVRPGEQATRIPDAPVVRLAIDRKVTWGAVKAILDVMQERGQEPVLLVTERHNVKAFRLEDAFEGPAIDLLAFTDGKSCVRHPDIPEAKCVQTPSGKYIDAAFTREIVREAVRGYQMTNVEVDLPPELNWDDAVRVIDAARTCCKDAKTLVKLRPPEPPDDNAEDGEPSEDEAPADAPADTDAEPAGSTEPGEAAEPAKGIHAGPA